MCSSEDDEEEQEEEEEGAEEDEEEEEEEVDVRVHNEQTVSMTPDQAFKQATLFSAQYEHL